jgi:hypothetical protein
MRGDSPTDGFRIAVSVAIPGHVEQLMRTALDIAREQGGDVFVVSVVVEPRSSPFWILRDDVIKAEFGGERQAVLDEAVAAAEGTDVAVEGRPAGLARSPPPRYRDGPHRRRGAGGRTL